MRVAHVGDRRQIVGDEEIGDAERAPGDRSRGSRSGRGSRRRARRPARRARCSAGDERERARDGDALALAARELVGEERRPRARASRPGPAVRARARRRSGALGRSLIIERLGHDGGRRASADRARHTDPGTRPGPPAGSARAPSRSSASTSLALEADRAAGRPLEAQDHLRRRRLAAARLADQPERLARADRRTRSPSTARTVAGGPAEHARGARESAWSGPPPRGAARLARSSASRGRRVAASSGPGARRRWRARAAPRRGSAPSRAGSAGRTSSPAAASARSGGWPSMAVSRPRRAPRRGIDASRARV